jgi:hypothetical protein
MSDLLLDIAPGHTIRGSVALDLPGPVLAVFCIFEFLDTTARRHKPNSKPGGGFAQAYWNRIEKDPRLSHIPITVAQIRAHSGRRSYANLVTTADGLLQILAIVQEKLPFDKDQPQTQTPPRQIKFWSNEEMADIFSDPVRSAQFIQDLERSRNPPPPQKQKINTELNATVADTLQRFIAGDRSMLRVIDASYVHDDNTAPQESLSNDLAPQVSLSNHPTTRHVYVRVAGHDVMGTYHPGIDDPVFSVYTFIEITRNHETYKHSLYYTRKIWEIAGERKLSFVKEAVMANIRCNKQTERISRTPALPLLMLKDLLRFIIYEAQDLERNWRNNTLYRGMWRNKVYKPIEQNILDEFNRFYSPFDKGDRSMIKDVH